jgi:hypothetical protein
MKKSDAESLIKKIDKVSQRNLFYHPSILYNAIAGAVIGGIIFGAIVWMITIGIISAEVLGQIGAWSPGTALFLGVITGSAIGGLFGSTYGTFAMLKERR